MSGLTPGWNLLPLRIANESVRTLRGVWAESSQKWNTVSLGLMGLFDGFIRAAFRYVTPGASSFD
jgi:hypothetical protein